MCPGDSLFHPGPPSPFSFRSPHLAFSKPSQAAQADMGQDGRGGVGRANKQVQVLLWDNTWGSGWSGPHQGLSLINSHTLAKGVNNGHRAAQQAERRLFCPSAMVQCGQGGVPRGTAVASEEGTTECRSLQSPQVQCQGSLTISHFLFFLPFPLPPSQSPRTKSNNCTGGSSS